MGTDPMPYWWEHQMLHLATDVGYYCVLPILIPILLYVGACYGIGWLIQFAKARHQNR